MGDDPLQVAVRQRHGDRLPVRVLLAHQLGHPPVEAVEQLVAAPQQRPRGLEVASERGDILRDLAAGALVEDPALTAAQARVAVTPTRVVLLLAYTGPQAEGERLVAWLLPEGATAEGPRVLAGGPGDGGELAVRLPRGTATTLVVSRELGPIGAGPAGAEVLRVALPGA